MSYNINKSKLKVLHINCNYVGTKLHRNLVEYLDKLNIDNNIFAPIYKERKIEENYSENVFVSKCFNKWDKIIFDYKQKKIYKSLTEHYDLNTFDIIHAYTLFTDGNCAMRTSKEYDIPYVVTIRDTDVNAFFKYRFYLRKRGVKIMKNASAVFFLSKTYMNEVIKKYVPESIREEILKKSYVVPNGIDDFWINNIFYNKKIEQSLNRIKNKKLKIIYVGLISKRKNIGLTLKAISKLQKKSWEIEFNAIGKIYNKREYRKLNKDPNFIYLGIKTKEELINFYRDFDIFIMPSITETFGLVYAEAMSQGLPVIYTKGQGFDGQFEEGKVGYHVNCKDCEDIAYKIEKIVGNYEYIVKNSVKCVEKFKWKDISEFYCKQYLKILKNKGKRNEENFICG